MCRAFQLHSLRSPHPIYTIYNATHSAQHSLYSYLLSVFFAHFDTKMTIVSDVVSYRMTLDISACTMFYVKDQVKNEHSVNRTTKSKKNVTQNRAQNTHPHKHTHAVTYKYGSFVYLQATYTLAT